jgi:hypothetical protein
VQLDAVPNNKGKGPADTNIQLNRHLKGYAPHHTLLHELFSFLLQYRSSITNLSY